MYTYLYIVIALIVLYGVYTYYISPRVNEFTKAVSDPQIHTYLIVINKCSKFDPRGAEKIDQYTKKFFRTLSESYVDQNKLSKLMFCKRKLMKYIHNMKFRIHNDANLIHEFETATENIESIIDNYITQAYEFNKKSYLKLI